MRDPVAIMRAAKVPLSVQPREFWPWAITRQRLTSTAELLAVGADQLTGLSRLDSIAHMHLVHGEVVMEDSVRELRRHLPIWMAAHGRVLNTGLGLGCVVRGLLTIPEVTHIDVVEIDAKIIEVVGAEFAGNPRVTIIHGDALALRPDGRRWDFAWHDIWTEGNDGLQALHARMMVNLHPAVGRQGAWAFPRAIARRLPVQLLGMKKIRPRRVEPAARAA